MSGNALIPLMGEPVQFGQSANQGAVAANNLYNLQENRRTEPMRMEALKAETDTIKTSAEHGKKLAQLQSAAIDTAPIYGMLGSGNVPGAIAAMEVRNNRLLAEGRDNTHTQRGLDALRSGDPAQIQSVSDELLNIQQTALQFGGGKASGGVSGAKRTDSFKNGAILQAMDNGALGLTLPSGQRISPNMPEWGPAMAAATQSGIAYAGDVAGAQESARGTVNNYWAPRTAADVATAQAGVELQTAPAIEAATTAATAGATAEADAAAREVKAGQVYPVFAKQLGYVMEAFRGTGTGPLVGRFSGFTDSSQRALAATQIIEPLLKSVVRDAGEGTFTEGDRAQIVDMMPKETDLPAVAEYKMEMLDSFVRGKLGVPDDMPAAYGQQGGAQGQPSGGGKLMIDAQGNKAMVYPDGRVEEQ